MIVNGNGSQPPPQPICERRNGEEEAVERIRNIIKRCRENGRPVTLVIHLQRDVCHISETKAAGRVDLR